LISLAFIIGLVVFTYLNIVIEELPKEETDFSLLKRLLSLRDRQFGNRQRGIALLGGVLAGCSVYYYGVTLAALTVFLVFAVLAVIAFIDMDTQYIPPELNLILAGLGIASIWTLPGPTIAERWIGMASISVPLILIVLVIPDGFGGGDIKMVAASGVLLGWKGNVAAFCISMVLGGVYGAWLLITKQKGKKEHFAFGPFLSIGIGVALYAGTGTYLTNQYLSLFT
jgi:leader peptidase (prepilin peptidase)/N-methyltransferase